MLTEEVNDVIRLEKTAKRKLLAFHHALGNDSKIYAPDDEDAESFGLFSTDPTEERDEQLRVLLWLRNFKEKNPELFKKIEDLPLKVRTGRRHNDETRKQYPTETTIAYLKNERRDTFYVVSESGEPQVISFLEAEKILKCNDNEQKYDITDSHYVHVRKCLDDFEKHYEANQSITQKTPKLTSLEKKAVTYLKAMMRESFVNDTEKKLLNKGIELITKKTYPNFYKEINKLSQSKFKPIEDLPKLLKIVKAHVVEQTEVQNNTRESVETNIGKPNIVISETLIND